MSFKTFFQHPRWRQRAFLALCTLALLASIGFAFCAYVSFQLMRSAYAVGVTWVSSLRGGMALRHVATTLPAKPGRSPHFVILADVGWVGTSPRKQRLAA